MGVKNLLARTVASALVAGLGPMPLWAADAVEIVRIDTLPGGETACPNTPAEAQRYVLSDGRTVLRCGGPIADPVGFLNGAAVPGLTVSGLAAGLALPEVAPASDTAPAASQAGSADAAPPTPVVEEPSVPDVTSPPVAAAETPAASAGAGAGDAAGPIGSGAWPETETSGEVATGEAAPDKSEAGNAAPGGTGATDTTAEDASDQAQPAPGDIASETPVEPEPATSTDDVASKSVTQEPAEPVTPAAPTEPAVQPATAATPRPEEKPAPESKKPRRVAAPAAAGRCADAAACYVQLGAFGEKKNVDRAKAVLRSLHLPVSTQQIRLRDGRQLTAVMAGPLDAASAERALGDIRGCGFKAAVLR